MASSATASWRTSASALRIDLLDGLQNVLPAGTPLFTQTNVSNLVDAYKWTELDEPRDSPS
jgi:hypothetical protein